MRCETCLMFSRSCSPWMQRLFYRHVLARYQSDVTIGYLSKLFECFFQIICVNWIKVYHNFNLFSFLLSFFLPSVISNLSGSSVIEKSPAIPVFQFFLSCISVHCSPFFISCLIWSIHLVSSRLDFSEASSFCHFLRTWHCHSTLIYFLIISFLISSALNSFLVCVFLILSFLFFPKLLSDFHFYGFNFTIFHFYSYPNFSPTGHSYYSIVGVNYQLL